MRRIISCFRVSTQKQGQSGLGLEAQRKAVADFLNGGRWEIVAEFVEVESGKRDDRPELEKPSIMGGGRVRRSLWRSSTVLRATRTSSSVFAQYERQLISKRTKEALAAAKARGVKLGNPNGAALLRRAAKGNVAVVAALKAGADRRARDLAEIIADVRSRGASSYRAIAAELNRQRITTARGGRWHACSVRDLETRAES
jgi:DNA invertase Pin-like site-specific DNA recombinase